MGKTKKGGDAKAGPDHETWSASVPADLSAKIKDWIRLQPAKVSRSAAIVALVKSGLKQSKGVT